VKIDINSRRKTRTRKAALEKPKSYQKALDLAEAGKHEEALGCIREYLSSSPKNAEALNDIGTILHCLNRSDEAIRNLIKAKSIQPDSAEIIWNLSEAYLAAGKAKEAMELFDDMERMDILNADVLNRTASVLLNSGNLSDAVEMLNRSLRLSPNQDILLPMIKIINSKMAEPSC
jgi:protein O-GlcNAc transferase